MGKFTAEEIQIAKAVDLVDLAEQIGIPLKRKGRFYQAVGMDSDDLQPVFLVPV